MTSQRVLRKREEAHRGVAPEDGKDAVSASGKTEEDKGRGECLAILQGLDLGYHNNRGHLAANWHRRILLHDGEVHIGLKSLLLSSEPFT